MKITMVGAGYVGLVSGACFADFGHRVTCVDHDPLRISALERGEMPIYEPGLDLLVAKNVKEGRLRFSTDLAEAARDAEAIFIAVGTPSRRGDGHADLSFVYAAAKEIAAFAHPEAIIVTKSTVPVGTGDEVERIARAARPGVEFAVVSNPEFLREGAAIGDFKRPDRIVIGTLDQRARDVMYEIYRPLTLNEPPIVFTDRRSSEMIKYAANAFLALKITFINEIADLCEKINADVQQIARGIGLDNRIGSKLLHPGPGFGGSCFPKDTQALVKTAQDAGAPLRIIETVMSVNDARKVKMTERVIQACGGSVQNKKIAILGLAFKPNTDDLREAPALEIINGLSSAGARIFAYDPQAMPSAKKLLPNIELADDAYSCVRGAEVLVIVTEWDEFRALDLDRIKKLMQLPVIVDLRNIYRPKEIFDQGFKYFSIGR